MSSKVQSSSGGIWMLVGLVALLAMPIVIDHMISSSAPDAHAEAPAAK